MADDAAWDAVLRWLAQQPLWQQDLARRVLHQNLDAAEYAAVLAAVAAATTSTPSEAPENPSTLVPLTQAGVPTSFGRPGTVVTRFGSLQQVGLASSGDLLSFGAEGLTVVYGANATGKSTVTRALRLLSRSVSDDITVRPDVLAAVPPASAQGVVGVVAVPSAQVETLTDGKLSASRVDLTPASRGLLTDLVAFDGGCADLLVSTRNEIAYVPEPLRVLTRLARAQDELRNLLADEHTRLASSAPKLPEFTGTSVAADVERLLTSPVQDVSILNDLTEQQQSRLIELAGVLAAAHSPASAADAAAVAAEARGARDLAMALVNAVRACTKERAEELVTARRAAEVAHKAVTIAAEARRDLAGVDDPVYATLWVAARSFVTKEGHAFPMVAGDICPLCRQNVTSGSADLLATFEEHVTSDLAERAKAADLAVADLLATLSPELTQPCRPALLSVLAASQPDLAAEIRAAVDQVEAHLRALAAGSPDAPLPDAGPLVASLLAHEASPEDEVARAQVAEDEIHTADPTASAAPATAEGLLVRLRLWAAERDAHAAALAASQVDETVAAARKEHADLDARRRLALRRSDLTGWQDTLRRMQEIAEIRSALATNRISTEIRELTATHATAAVTQALVKEVEALNCTLLPVSLDWSTAKGTTSAQLLLDGTASARLNEIASDGELRAIALAFHFAELSAAGCSTLLYDDPVCSLDDERRYLIADRIVQEAGTRQVIVFTHELTFLLDLLAQAEAADVKVHVQHMWRLGREVGRVDQQLPFRTMDLSARIGDLKNRAAQWDSQSPTSHDEAWRRVENFYKDLRISWERAVEERLFQGVVLRHERPIKTLKLRHVVVNQDLLDDIEAGMTRASFYVHDEPRAASLPLPTRAEVATDVEALEAFSKKVPRK